MMGDLEKKDPPGGGSKTCQLEERTTGQAGRNNPTPDQPSVLSRQNARTSGGPWGATPDDWAHFDLILGLTADLLPVVSNPHAEKSAESKIQGPGKTPSDYNTKGLMRGFANWTSHQATPADIAKWSAQPDYGICLQTREVRALDIDIEDFEESVDAEVFIKERLSVKLPVRRRDNANKFLMLFMMPGDFKKRRFSTKTDKGAIEFLATGQQAVMVGTHPTGARYVWPEGLPNEIPELTEGEFFALWSALHERFGSTPSTEGKSGKPLSKPRTAADISDPVVDYLYDEGHVLSESSEGKIFIRCPNEAEHTTDSGETATAYFPAGVGGYEQGHFACLHSHCQHLTNQDFKAKIGYLDRDMPVVAELHKPTTTPPFPNFSRIKGGAHSDKVEPTRRNVIMALERPDICGYQLRFDTFLDAVMIAEHDGGQWREFVDEDYTAIGLHLEFDHPGFRPPPLDTIKEAVRYVAQRNKFDTAQAWLNSLSWDGVSRVDSFFPRFAGAENSEYTKAIGRYFWSALAGRALSPGVKADMTPIAIGNQGLRKSTFVKALVPDDRFFGEIDFSADDKELGRTMRGKLILELGELRGYGAKQLEHTKAFLSRQTDEWRPVFKEFTRQHARRVMFFGTTNDSEILVDDTGNRRWLPFTSTGADPVGAAAIRDQLWAEGAHLFKQHGVLWSDAERLAAGEHDAFTQTDPWDSDVIRYLNAPVEIVDEDGKPIFPACTNGEHGVSTTEILRSVIGLPLSKIGRGEQKRAAKILKRLGYVGKQERITKDIRDKTTGNHRDREYIYRRGANV